MKKKIAFITIFIFLNLKITFPQGKIESSNNNFGLSIGLTEYQVKEKILNNIRHRGMFISGGLFYEKIKESSHQKYELYIIPNALKSRYDPDKASKSIHTFFDYRYTRKVKNINKDLSVYLGGIAGFESHISYYENWNDSHLYWLTSYYLGSDAMLKYHPSEKNIVSLDINIPVIALISRPPERTLYKLLNPEFSWIVRKFHENLRLVSIHQHFVLNMKLGYTFQYSSKFKQSVYWRFMYLNNNMTYSKELNILAHSLGTSFHF